MSVRCYIGTLEDDPTTYVCVLHQLEFAQRIDYDHHASDHDAKIAATERIAQLYRSIANDECAEVCRESSDFYSGARELLLRAIDQTYPDVKATTVHDLMLQSEEPVEVCVRFWRERDADHYWCDTVQLPGDDPGGRWRCKNHGVEFP